jgi:hypothetical protein
MWLVTGLNSQAHKWQWAEDDGMKRLPLSTFMFVVLIVALGLGLVMQHDRASRRERVRQQVESYYKQLMDRKDAAVKVQDKR